MDTGKSGADYIVCYIMIAQCDIFCLALSFKFKQDKRLTSLTERATRKTHLILAQTKERDNEPHDYPTSQEPRRCPPQD